MIQFTSSTLFSPGRVWTCSVEHTLRHRRRNQGHRRTGRRPSANFSIRNVSVEREYKHWTPADRVPRRLILSLLPFSEDACKQRIQRQERRKCCLNCNPDLRRSTIYASFSMRRAFDSRSVGPSLARFDPSYCTWTPLLNQSETLFSTGVGRLGLMHL